MPKYLSYSALTNFYRCPFSFYLQKILKVKLKLEYKNAALRRGLYFMHLFKPEIHEDFFLNPVDIELVEVLHQTIVDLDLLPQNSEYECESIKQIDEKTWLKGIFDLQWTPSWQSVTQYYEGLGEIKLTSKPEFYTNTFFALNQLKMYLYLSRYPKAYMLPVRWPATRQAKEETVDEYIERTRKDILKRPGHYFPEYKADRTPPRWGKCFYLQEFEPLFEELEKELVWAREEIRRCNKAKYFPKTYNCLFPGECDFMSVCSTGYVNEELYNKANRN